MNFKWLKNRRVMLTAGVLAASVGAIALIMLLSSGKPPTDKIERARKAISEALKEEADIYSRENFEVAQKWWRESMDEWRENNERSVLLRRYDKVEEFAQFAIDEALKAREAAIIKKKELKRTLEGKLETLKKSVQYIQLVTGKLPLNHNIRNRATPYILKLNEAELAFNRNNLIDAESILNRISSGIEKLESVTSSLLEDYFRSYPRWIKEDREMRELSAVKGVGVTLVVDKFSRKCILYKSGKKFREFDVELGVNWLGDKVQRGDKATPEGRYTITAKKSGRSTIYYKALLINFPNKEDIKRFNDLKAKGRVPKNAHIGGLIEIHGGGGKGIDWTDGCVALDNRDMDYLYSVCSVGTHIAIVGSLSPLKDILK
jgi:hypothetical protein